MTTIMMQLGDIPITSQGILVGMLLGMVGSLALMVMNPKGRLNEVFTWMTALLSIGFLVTLAISNQFFF